jgi:hypothetical protein
MPPSWDVGLPPPMIFQVAKGVYPSGNLSRAGVIEVTTPVRPEWMPVQISRHRITFVMDSLRIATRSYTLPKQRRKGRSYVRYPAG